MGEREICYFCGTTTPNRSGVINLSNAMISLLAQYLSKYAASTVAVVALCVGLSECSYVCGA